ncbi:uncharacterized conserved protein [Moorella thermoacetica Y72]|uniref:Uncharacterized conserved protein n=1 Tax=Moorella thermoacetica Y72 TaxID=1325331 RepID=A0A0S6UAL6_NEOTH|nr:uncharacterized conserved protein [Moorella thermoacetica Y72]
MKRIWPIDIDAVVATLAEAGLTRPVVRLQPSPHMFLIAR